MSKRKGKAVTACIMLLLSALLYAIVCLRPDTLVIVLGIFAVPGFVACWAVLYQWLIFPNGCTAKSGSVTKYH